MHEALRGIAHEGGWCDQSNGSTVSTPLSVAGCGRLQLGVPHWATSVDYCKQLMIYPTFCDIFSTGRLLAIEDFTLFLPSIDPRGWGYYKYIGIWFEHDFIYFLSMCLFIQITFGCVCDPL